MTSKTKRCTKCKEVKSLDEYFNRAIAKDGKNTHCKECEKAAIAEWRKSNKPAQAAINRRNHLRYKYDISEEQYDELLKKQNYSCAICERHEETLKFKLAVDHNHVTNEIRGLLCTYCNHRVIGRHRDGNLLRKMADYVDGGTGWFVPEKKRRRKPRKVKKIGKTTRSKNTRS